ncbi:MAG: DUF4424 family protein [Paracoccaceae bacterium]
MVRPLPSLPAIIALIAALAFAPAHANDSAGGLDATGLFFTQTDQVVIQSEDLTIGLDRIAVDYVFRNISDRDFTTEMMFPMPPLDLEDMRSSGTNLPVDMGRENLLNFTATVDGQITSGGYAAFTNYVLRTANSWSGPIGTFRLTLDKGQPDNVISLSIDGIRKTGATTFTVEKANFIPDRDLRIVVILPVANITKNRN